jgi:hypothetical protein
MAKGLEPLPGRKSIVLFSDGLDVMSLGEGSALRDAARHLVDVANRSSVIINTIHATGLQTAWPRARAGASCTTRTI